MALPPLQDLLDLLPDNTSGEIEAVDMRDVTTSLYNGIQSNEDNFDNFLPVSGLVPLQVGYSPTLPLNIATKEYVDSATGGDNYVNITGDTMTGSLFLPISTPTEYTEATNKGYVDNEDQAVLDFAASNYLSVFGGSMVGSLLLSSDPINLLEAATKQYVDTVASSAIPSGSIQMYAGTGATPSGWLLADGSEVDKATYSNLYTAIGDAYGTPVDSNNFVLPDYRGRFARFSDLGAGVDIDAASRTDRGDGTTGSAVGTLQEDAIRNFTGRFDVMRGASGEATVSSASGIVSGIGTNGKNTNRRLNGTATSQTWNRVNITASAQVPTGSDNRPTNIYATAIIKI